MIESLSGERSCAVCFGDEKKALTWSEIHLNEAAILSSYRGVANPHVTATANLCIQDRRFLKKDLTCTHQKRIHICMRTTLNIDDGVLQKAAEITGIGQKTSLVRMGLEALIALESAKRLANLGGTQRRLRPIPRRRP
jgi:Arc/MetJ family transcription regulator